MPHIFKAGDNLIRLSEASKKYDVPYTTIMTAIRAGKIESVKEGRSSYVDEEEFVKWSNGTQRRKGYKREQKTKPEPTIEKPNEKSNNSIFITLLMKIFGELSKIEGALSGPAQITVQQVKKEIMSTIQGVKL